MYVQYVDINTFIQTCIHIIYIPCIHTYIHIRIYIYIYIYGIYFAIYKLRKIDAIWAELGKLLSKSNFR
jgi:hypothetical protein